MITQVVLYTDMIGYKSLSIPSTDDYQDFNAIALDTQNFVSKELLGDELYNAFSTDLDAGSGTPTEQKWLDLLNGVTWTDVVNPSDTTENVIRNNEGLKGSWKYFVYREWLNQAPFVSNFTGKSVNNAINGEPLGRQSLNIETENRYNQGVDIYETVRKFVEYYKEYSVEYTSIVESPAGTYTVNLTDTTYIKDGDYITIDNDTRYTISNLIADTSFTFTATAGTVFWNDEVTWYPFEDARNGVKGKLYFNGMI